MRISKSGSEGTTTYTVEGTTILAEKRILDSVETLITYHYGSDGIFGFTYNGTEYYYGKNLFGDITDIYDTTGYKVAHYVYDAWGNTTVCNGVGSTNYDPAFIGNINPFRYRGYYFDTETGFYYLQSRYYDPVAGRFLNADSLAYLGADGELRGYNLYTYCGNDPVMNVDPTGHFVFSILFWIALSSAVGTYTNEGIGVANNTSNRTANIVKKSGALKLFKPADPIVKYDGESFVFDFSINPDYNIFTSFYYANKLYEMGLPDDRTYLGIWFELLVHYIVHQFDVFDWLVSDNEADMGNYQSDDNAFLFEGVIHGIMNGLENWYYDKW